MIQVSNATAQTLQPGQALTFDSTSIMHAGCGECFNEQLPQSVKLQGGCKSIYQIGFSGNVTANAATTAVQLSLAISGQPLSNTVMNATPAAAGDLVNVNTGLLYRVGCCDADRVSVINTGTAPIVVAPNASLRVSRRA